MKIRTLLLLLGLAIVSTAAAIWAIMERPAYMSASVTDEPAFPALRQAPDSVEKISISGRFGGFTILRTDDGWITPEKFGFEVNGEKVAALVTSLSDMRLVAQKTSGQAAEYFHGDHLGSSRLLSNSNQSAIA